MAGVTSGKWAKGSGSTSVEDRYYFSGDLTVTNTAYAGSPNYEFGFSTPELLIVNTSATRLYVQWLSQSGAGDGAAVPANGSLALSFVNKTGVRLRVDGGSATCYVIALG